MGVTQVEVGGQTEKGERQYKMHSRASYEKCFERSLENGQNLTQSCPTGRAKAGFLINQVLFGYLLKFVVRTFLSLPHLQGQLHFYHDRNRKRWYLQQEATGMHEDNDA